jgi:methyl-accepting chemotaxis protein
MVPQKNSVWAVIVTSLVIITFLLLHGKVNYLSYLILLSIPILFSIASVWWFRNQKKSVDLHQQQLEQERQTMKIAENYLNEISGGNLEVDIKEPGDNGGIFNAIEKLRLSMKQAKKEEMQRKNDDAKRSWASEGIARLGEIVRGNDSDLKRLSEKIISFLVKYVEANQGGIFIINDEEEYNKSLEMVACYAFDRKKFLQKSILPGEGLAGACYVEKKTIYITAVPKDYTYITSGLGDEVPGCILIVPLILNEEVHGVLELASFKTFEPYQVEFIERIAENIAGTVSSVRINTHTASLLHHSQQQAEEMKAQEEEMRQNNEELMATQEEMEKKNMEMQMIQKSLLDKNEKLKQAARELSLVEGNLQSNITRLKNEL